MARQKMYQPHYSNAADSRIVQTRETLRRAFLELLAAKPVEQITIREVVAAAGIGYNTFFRHYTSKEALLEEIVAGEVKHLVDLSCSVLDTTNSLEASKALCAHVDENDALWSTLLNGGAANSLRNAFIEHLREVAPARISNKTKAYPAELGVKLVAAGTIEVLSWWLAQTKRPSIARTAAIYEQLVVVPIISAYKN